jgi:hypothetical protein
MLGAPPPSTSAVRARFSLRSDHFRAKSDAKQVLDIACKSLAMLGYRIDLI